MTHPSVTIHQGYGAAVPTPPSRRGHFAAAGQRHLVDGQHLHSRGRLATADHLAGLAAECVLKAILLHFLGATMGRIKPTTTGPSGTSVHYGHLPGIWDEVAVHANGRAGAQFVALLATPNPYTDWNIADRYRDGSTITGAATHKHIQAAADLGRVYQRAILSGALQ